MVLNIVTNVSRTTNSRLHQSMQGHDTAADETASCTCCCASFSHSEKCIQFVACSLLALPASGLERAYRLHQSNGPVNMHRSSVAKVEYRGPYSVQTYLQLSQLCNPTEEQTELLLLATLLPGNDFVRCGALIVFFCLTKAR